MPDRDDLKRQVERQCRRMKQAEHDRPTLLAQTVFLGTLGLLLVLPVVAGAYLGLWLDGLHEDYTVRWTLGCILLGVGLGTVNVWLFIREK